MIGVNSSTISNLLRNCSSFKGVYPCDKIPPSLHTEKQFSIICNLSTAEEKGSHFITIIIFKDYAMYIDSMGWECFNVYIKRFLRSLNRFIFTNQKQYQDYGSSYCGLYCVLHVLHFNTSRKYQEENKLVFTDNMTQNDQKCVSSIKRLLKYNETNIEISE